MLKKTLISIGEVLFGDVLTDRPGDVLAIHPGTFWFGDVLTGHCVMRPALGRRNREVWGDNVPHFWASGIQEGTGGSPMKIIFASTADSLYSVLYK